MNIEKHKEKVLVVYSGGLDSTVLLYSFLDNFENVTALNFTYGSKHNPRENEAAERITENLKVPLIRMDISSIFKGFKSTLIDKCTNIPEGHYKEETMKSTIVPFRNGILLSIATSIAENEGIRVVSYGAHAGDHYIYPDCTPEFMQTMSLALMAGTENRIILSAPFSSVTKDKIVKHGQELNVPFEETWTCYNGGSVHCGVCGACNERKEAFKLANVTDLTTYKI